ncbi:MAG: type II toxin-antitoxin system HicB family antitoxin [Isosphaeraceae bacterium]
MSVAENSAAAIEPVTVVVTVRLQALAVREPSGGYSVVVPALPGCVTEGDDLDEVRANIVEAAEAWLDSQHDHRKEAALRSLIE